MARVTVEDCLENVDNRFELVLLAAKRARQLSRGFVEPLVSANGDKPTVIALREIAERGVDKTILDQELLKVAANDDMNEISEEIIAETQQTENDAEENVAGAKGGSDDEDEFDEDEDIAAEIDAEVADVDSSDDSEE